MAQQLNAELLAPLLSVAANDTDGMVRVAALDAASRFPLNPEAWQIVAKATWLVIRTELPGSPARRQVLALAVRIPLRSVRIHLRRMANKPDEVDRDAIAAALDEVGDPSRVQSLLKQAASDCGAAFRWLAAMRVEGVIAPVDVPPLPPEAETDAQFWRALVLARLGEFEELDAFLSGELPEPELFWGSPWDTYDEIERIRPVPGPMRAHLLEALSRLNEAASQSNTERLLQLTVWAATGIADAEGDPIVMAKDQSLDLAPKPSPELVRQALDLRAHLPAALFDEQLDFASLNYLPADSVPGLITDVISEGNRRALAAGPENPEACDFGNSIIDLMTCCPLIDDWSVAELVLEQLRAERPALDDGQFAWIIARAGTDRLISELVGMLTAERTGDERLRILHLLGAAADVQSGRGGSPWRGAGPSGGALAAPAELIDDIPQDVASRQSLDLRNDQLSGSATITTGGGASELKIADNSHDSHDSNGRVMFSVFGPQVITPGQNFVLDLWAHLPTQAEMVLSLATKMGRGKMSGVKTGVAVGSGAILSVLIEIPSLRIPDPIDTMTWEGEPANSSFIIETPSDAASGEHTGRVILSACGLPLAKISFSLTVTARGVGPDETRKSLKAIERRLGSAFASYSSLDRDEVFGRVQGMKKVLPELDIFIDVLSLRSGQDWEQQLRLQIPAKDVFFLFWSLNASRSKEVDKEWRLALELRGLNYIDPIPLVEPRESPPPQELTSLHFNDLYLAYMQSSRGGTGRLQTAS
jgi:TIR domain